VTQKKFCTQDEIIELFRKPQGIEEIQKKTGPVGLSDYKLNTVYHSITHSLTTVVSGTY
jgi:hypothetical protein